jgi:hypothetical protein
MKWSVPIISGWRELPRFAQTGPVGLHHMRGPSDFCIHCHQDLRVPMVLVNAISHADRSRYELCSDAFNAEEEGDHDSISKCNEHRLTADERQNLARLFNQGWRVVLEGSCGPDDMAFVGVTTDAILLLAVEDEYEVGNQIRLRYEEKQGKATQA